MADEWIKWTKGLARKREVVAISNRLEMDRRLTAALLMQIWEWADDNTTDGNVPGVDFAFLDELVGVAGFADEMAREKWLRKKENGVFFPKFSRHNGASAKRRAQENRRKRRERASASDADKMRTRTRTREEKILHLIDRANVSCQEAQIVTQLKDYASENFQEVYSRSTHDLLMRVAVLRLAGLVSDDFIHDGLTSLRNRGKPPGSSGGWLRKVWRDSKKGPLPADSGWFEEVIKAIELPKGLRK